MSKNLINSILKCSDTIAFEDLLVGECYYYYFWWGNELFRLLATVSTKTNSLVELDSRGIKFSLASTQYGQSYLCQQQ